MAGAKGHSVLHQVVVRGSQTYLVSNKETNPTKEDGSAIDTATLNNLRMIFKSIKNTYKGKYPARIMINPKETVTYNTTN
jgi:hypothetical protein